MCVVVILASPTGAAMPRRAATEDRSPISSRTLASDCLVAHRDSLGTESDILSFIYTNIFFTRTSTKLRDERPTVAK